MALGSSEGWFSRLKNGLSRTRVNIVGLFSGGVVDEDFLEELEFALISADVGVETTTHILERLRSDIKLKGLKTQEEVKLALRDELVTILKSAEGVLNVDQAKPCVIMMCGVNGAGKTTSIGKLAKRFADNGKSVQVLSGIKAGDRVVTQGAYQVKLASASNAIPAPSHEHKRQGATARFRWGA